MQRIKYKKEYISRFHFVISYSTFNLAITGPKNPRRYPFPTNNQENYAILVVIRQNKQEIERAFKNLGYVIGDVDGVETFPCRVDGESFRAHWSLSYSREAPKHHIGLCDRVTRWGESEGIRT